MVEGIANLMWLADALPDGTHCVVDRRERQERETGLRPSSAADTRIRTKL